MSSIAQYPGLLMKPFFLALASLLIGIFCCKRSGSHLEKTVTKRRKAATHEEHQVILDALMTNNSRLISVKLNEPYFLAGFRLSHLYYAVKNCLPDVVRVLMCEATIRQFSDSPSFCRLMMRGIFRQSVERRQPIMIKYLLEYVSPDFSLFSAGRTLQTIYREIIDKYIEDSKLEVRELDRKIFWPMGLHFPFLNAMEFWQTWILAEDPVAIAQTRPYFALWLENFLTCLDNGDDASLQYALEMWESDEIGSSVIKLVVGEVMVGAGRYDLLPLANTAFSRIKTEPKNLESCSNMLRSAIIDGQVEAVDAYIRTVPCFPNLQLLLSPIVNNLIDEANIAGLFNCSLCYTSATPSQAGFMLLAHRIFHGDWRYLMIFIEKHPNRTMIADRSWEILWAERKCDDLIIAFYRCGWGLGSDSVIGAIMIQDPDIDRLKELIDLFTISTEHLTKIASDFKMELLSSLRDGNRRMLKCLSTFVSKSPTGQETGDYFLIDLGGTHLRVGHGKLLGEQQYLVQRESIIIPEEIKKGSGHALFEFIAQHMIGFALRTTSSDGLRKVGFTFSFPVEQESLTHGRLIQFNKAFDCHDIIGLDMVNLLQLSLDNIKPGFLKVGCLVNDTVGTLAAHAYKNPSTKMAVILGTGTNAAYYEPEKQMVINIEWGGFGDNVTGSKQVLPVTQYDKTLDTQSENCGKQTFEKMISGMYLGEIFRLASQDWIREDLDKPYAITTRMLADISTLTRPNLTQELSALLQVFASSILKRSASLSAALISSVYQHASSTCHKFVVAIDGSLYTKNKEYPGLLDSSLRSLVNSDDLIVESSHGEPLIGPAIIIASHL